MAPYGNGQRRQRLLQLAKAAAPSHNDALKDTRLEHIKGLERWRGCCRRRATRRENNFAGTKAISEQKELRLWVAED